ncbi:hypothetical protein [[Clostridium] fimetarium]|uniref:Uncharacterized protein n=1 Tax=[Clostridium] fimetarium TaxID=99656 RepID=A0A1I0QCE5_9FIRM|nr:hypothetical protein [[Clostridium] fimetarium]SEW24551.1 hypothetical protein SAMN05421659_107176 [[Clostridium] fimetarium]
MKKSKIKLFYLLSILLLCACNSKTSTSNVSENISQSATTISKETTADKKTITTLPDGTIIEKSSDGTTIERSSDGTTKEIQANGTVIKTAIDGTITETKIDGTVILTKTDGYRIETSPDGSTKEIQTATQLVTEKPTEAQMSTQATTESSSQVPAPTEAPITPIEAPPTEAPVATTGRTYGYYTNCTTTGLIQDKTEYGNHRPYEYFKLTESPIAYCIAYAEDALSYGVKPKFNSLLGLTSTMKEFSDYGKSKGGNGVVGVELSDFGYYNGLLVCVVSVDLN